MLLCLLTIVPNPGPEGQVFPGGPKEQQRAREQTASERGLPTSGRLLGNQEQQCSGRREKNRAVSSSPSQSLLYTVARGGGRGHRLQPLVAALGHPQRHRDQPKVTAGTGPELVVEWGSWVQLQRRHVGCTASSGGRHRKAAYCVRGTRQEPGTPKTRG